MFAGISAQAGDWYRWRGPDLNGISTETGWQTKWPEEGPKQLWKASVGTGFSSVSVSRGRLYTMGHDGNKTETVYCFDAATGAPVWSHSYGNSLDPKYFEGGPSATPTVDGNCVYTLSRRGHVFALDAAKGTLLWTTNVEIDLGFQEPTWGFSGSVLIEGDLAILNVGNAGLALNKKTGAVVWRSDKTPPGYSTPVLFTNGTDRLALIFSVPGIQGVNVKDGTLAWTFPWKTYADMNIADPVLSGKRMLVSSDYDHGCALVDISKDKPMVIWQNKNLRTHIDTAVIWKGFIYGVDDGDGKSQLKCISLEKGEERWANAKFGKGTVMIADGKIIGLSDKGELMVIEPSPEGFKPISTAQVLGGKNWTVPVLANGRIYCRNAKGDLICLDVAGK